MAIKYFRAKKMFADSNLAIKSPKTLSSNISGFTVINRQYTSLSELMVGDQIP